MIHVLERKEAFGRTNALHPVLSNGLKVSPGFRLDWKTWKMGRHFPVREKSGNFEETGKFRENHTKY